MTCGPAAFSINGMNSITRSRVAWVALLLFCSGTTALAIQVGWMREFRLVFGASTAASAAVVAIFMGGLGLGNALLGRRADRVRSPLLMYAALELGVGLTAAVSPFLIDAVRGVYTALGGQSVLGLGGATAVRLGLTTAVLAVPTILMGGTLPAAVRAATPADDERRRSAGWLYGANTLGAVAGATASNFLLLPGLGTRVTLWLGCSLSVIVAASAWALARRPVGETHAEGSTDRETEPRPAASRAGIAPPWVYGAAAIVGFAFFLMELVWYRMLGPILAGTTYTFGLILAVALLGIGIGGALYAPIFRRATPSVRAFALSCGLEAALIALPFALGDRLALLAAHCHEVSQGFAQSVAGWAVVAGIVVLPAAIVSGVQFPLLIALLGRGDRNVGRQVGFAFAWNTLGAILGSLAGGFGALPLLTAPGTWIAVVLLLVVLAAAAAAWSFRCEGKGYGLAVPLAAAGLALLLVTATGPTAAWRHSGIGAGRFTLPEGDANVLRNWAYAKRRHVLWEAEGVEASIGLVADNGLSFFINGKCDGNAIRDAGTQLVSGVLAAMLHPDPKSAFIVGLGTGETPGWLAEVPSIERVDVVELEPAINEMARRCADVNHDVLHHPKVHMVYDDAREVLLTIPTRYDLIFSEPSNPYRAGIANLFTREFYVSVRQRLNDDGLFVQWVQGYEIDKQTVSTICATLRTVFDHVEIWQSKAEDMLMVCSQQPLQVRAEECRRRVTEEPFASAYARAWRVTDLEGVLARFVGGAKLVEALRQEAESINTDDHNLVEYGFARTVGQKTTGFSVHDLRQTAVALGAHCPTLVNGTADWHRVEDHRQLLQAMATGDVLTPPEATAEQQARTAALGRYWQGDAQGMVATWRAAGYQPLYPTETALLALACAHLGDDGARPLLEELRKFDSIEAEAIAVHLLVRRGRYPEAAERIEPVLVGLRTHPWCLPHALELIFPDAVEIAARHRNAAGRLYAALGEPFAVYLHEEDRLAAAHAVANLLGPQAIVEALQAYEPHVPWNEAFLENRYRAYKTVGHPLTSEALADWEAFQRSSQTEGGLEKGGSWGRK